MIYLLLTASVQNHTPSSIQEDRLSRYRYAITETLSHVPRGVQPILVENTGRGEALEGFLCHGQPVPVVRTENGGHSFRNKGVNEWLDVREVLERVGLQDQDVVVKLTGRYRLLSPSFLENIQREEKDRDAWFRFLNVCTGENDPNDCVLGCYGAKVGVLRFLSWSWLNLFDSPEKGMARFIRSSVSPSRLAEMDRLDVECVFSEDGRVRCV